MRRPLGGFSWHPQTSARFEPGKWAAAPVVNSFGRNPDERYSVANELKVVIVDDDQWKRAGMRQRLDATPEVIVVDDVDQDSAAAWPLDKWTEIDAVLVDVFDDQGVGEVGTDIYSGIKVVERVRPIRGLRCIAVTPSCPHPLVQLRLHQAQPDFCYHRYELANLHMLTEAVRFPERNHRLPAPDAAIINGLGARNLRANDVVRAFEASALHGRIYEAVGHKVLNRGFGVSRRAVDRFKKQVVDCGFNHLEVLSLDGHAYDESPRWPAVRTLVLRLLGRKDAPWSEHDKPWWP